MSVAAPARWTGARPSLRFVFAHPAHFIACVGIAGLARRAPGTFGTLAALPAWWAMQGRLGDAQIACVIGALFVVGVWAAHVAGRSLGVQDHGGIVIDEFVAMLAVLFVLPAGALWQAVGFGLFRFFDIVKPPPIRQYERQIRGGFGVMFDDALAALGALMVVALWQTI